VSAVDAEGVRASLPSDPAARQPYVEGLTRLRRSDALAARDLFLKAASAEPNSPLVHARLADAWSALGYDDHARTEAKAAFDLSGRLMQPQRLWIEANFRRMTQEWDLAVEIYHRLQGFFPDDPECALQLAEVQIVAGRSKEAISTIEMFKRWPTPLGDDPRLDLAEAAAARGVGDLPRQLQAAQRAVSKGSAQHARNTMAYAELQEGRAYREAGRLQEAIDAATRGKETFAALGDQAGYARALMDVANALTTRGNVVARRAMYVEARTVYRQIGHKKGEANSLNNIAGVLETLGDFAAAQHYYEEALAIRRAIDDRTGVALSLNNIADALQWQGDLAGSRRMYEQALTAYRRMHSPDGIAFVLSGLGEVLTLQGELSQARIMAEDAVRAWRAIGTRDSNAAAAFSVLGDVRLAQGHLAEALSAYEEALAMINGASGKTAVRLHIARLWIEEGRSAEAEPVIRQAREQFHGEGETLNELQANVLLTKAFLDQGKPTEAEGAVEDGKRLGTQTRSKIALLELAIVTAQVHAAKGNLKSAIESLKTVLAATQRCGCLALEFEARLALSRIELNAGERHMGQARLALLQRDADAKGSVLIARKAKAAMAGPAQRPY
jgi:tetratricopeptide (TPR) repeat protein